VTDNNEKVHMHHKFCVIDGHILITGSFNWTNQAVKENQENVIILNDKELCMKYTAEYNKLWEQFKNNKVIPNLEAKEGFPGMYKEVCKEGVNCKYGSRKCWYQHPIGKICQVIITKG